MTSATKKVKAPQVLVIDLSDDEIILISRVLLRTGYLSEAVSGQGSGHRLAELADRFDTAVKERKK